MIYFQVLSRCRFNKICENLYLLGLYDNFSSFLKHSESL